MSLPTILVEIAFTTRPFAASTTYTDVTAYVRDLSVSRGRSGENGQPRAGTATVTLSNGDRRFDPTHTAGPYYGNIKPMRRLRISATWNGTTYRLFTGFLDAMPQEWPGQTDALVQVSATDGFGILSKPISGTFPEASSHYRLAAIADAVGWPAVDRFFTTGSSTMQAVTIDPMSAVSAMELLAHIEASEAGRLYISGSGQLVWIGRHGLLGSPYTVSQATFGDAAGELGYTDITVPYGIEQVFNVIQTSVVGGIESNGAVQVTVAAPGSSSLATTLPVTALPISLTSGTSLTFTGGFVAVLAADATAGATSLSTDPLPFPFTAGMSASYSSGGRSGVLVTVAAPGASAAAATLPVTALGLALPSGTVLPFGPGRIARLSAAAAIGATSLAVDALYGAIATGATSVYMPGQFVAADAASTDDYLLRPLPMQELLLTSSNEAQDMAWYLLARLKAPQLQFSDLSLAPEGDPAGLWPKALGFELNTRITVKRRPPGGGSAISQESQIQDITHTYAASPQSWTTTWRLSLADPTSYWLLGDTTYGVLGTTTIPAF